MKNFKTLLLLLTALALISCNQDEPDPRFPVLGENGEFSLEDIASVMSELPIAREHLDEVHDAVNSSSGNGYDEEYMMSDLFASPGAGVGDKSTKATTKTYSNPLKDLFAAYFSDRYATRAGGDELVKESLDAIAGSDMQIYWPYSENWDGESYPVVTYDPGDGSEVNYGYEIFYDDSGERRTRRVTVSEEMAASRPVWVINRNDDSEYTPLGVFEEATQAAVGSEGQGAEPSESKGNVLLLRSFKALRNYDSWFAGGSEFFVKCGAVNGFRATTDEELREYTPSVTDFMVVVKRSQIGRSIPLNTVLLTDFTEQMEKMAFLIMEDDGGQVTSWKCEAVVKYKSKSFGFTLDIPYRDRDDIVWRGQLSSDFLRQERFVMGRFGDVEIIFETR